MMRFLWIFLIVTHVSCVTKPDTDSAESFFAYAKEFYDNENDVMAVEKLHEFRSRYPYSKYASEALLMIAESEYRQGKYEEAIVQFDHFSRLYPNHGRADRAQFMIGKSYWQIAPKAYNQEQSFTRQAVEVWETFIVQYPESELMAEARQLVQEGKKRIAESQNNIAEFYCRREIYYACAMRAIEVADRFSTVIEVSQNALELAAVALDKLAKADEDSERENWFQERLTDQELQELADSLKKRLEGMARG